MHLQTGAHLLPIVVPEWILFTSLRTDRKGGQTGRETNGTGAGGVCRHREGDLLMMLS